MNISKYQSTTVFSYTYSVINTARVKRWGFTFGPSCTFTVLHVYNNDENDYIITIHKKHRQLIIR